MKKISTKTSKNVAVVILAMATAFMVSGCSADRTVTTTETHTDADGNTITTTSTQTIDKDGEVKNETAVIETEPEDAPASENYEGFYCRTDTEEIEDYEVTYTHGYQLNADGTGMAYEQDNVDFTWDENEMHFAINTEPFEIENGKLIVSGLAFDKIGGKFITPNPCLVNVDNLENGIYHAEISDYSINEAEDKVTIDSVILTEDSYDIVDINRMAEGDVIFIKGRLIPVNTIEHTASGIIEINGGVENNGSALIADDESNCFVYAGIDMERSYTFHGLASLAVSDNVKFTDKSDPAQTKEYTGSDAISAVKEAVQDNPLTCYNCTITVENGEIVEINRLYMP